MMIKVLISVFILENVQKPPKGNKWQRCRNIEKSANPHRTQQCEWSCKAKVQGQQHTTYISIL